MRRLLVILGILFIGLLYSYVGQSDERCYIPAEDSELRNSPDEQRTVIRDYMFILNESEVSSSAHSSSISRIPTRTLQQNVSQRMLLIMARQSALNHIKTFALRATVFFKRLPFSKNYFIYYLSRIIC